MILFSNLLCCTSYDIYLLKNHCSICQNMYYTKAMKNNPKKVYTNNNIGKFIFLTTKMFVCCLLTPLRKYTLFYVKMESDFTIYLHFPIPLMHLDSSVSLTAFYLTFNLYTARYKRLSFSLKINKKEKKKFQAQIQSCIFLV